jgi:hypothetical protein
MIFHRQHRDQFRGVVLGQVSRQLRLAVDRLRALCRAKPQKARVLYTKPSDWEGLTFSQKIRWRCRYPDPKVDYAIWADKYRAKQIVAGVFEVPWTYAIIRNPEEITAVAVPKTFVMKATHSWNMSLLVENGIVRGGNRSTKDAGRPSDPTYLRDVAIAWMNSEEHAGLRRAVQPYRNVEFGVIFEDYLCPVDYEIQLFLFAGHCKIALVFFRPFFFENVEHQIYDENWTLREASAAHVTASSSPRGEVPRPPDWLFKALERLCWPIDHVRVDFMVSGDRYYFSEFTFTHNGRNGPGFIASFDSELGRHWAR